VFVNAFLHLADFELGRDFGAWLRTIARNAVRVWPWATNSPATGLGKASTIWSPSTAAA